jgi:hypothetical protein
MCPGRACDGPRRVLYVAGRVTSLRLPDGPVPGEQTFRLGHLRQLRSHCEADKRGAEQLARFLGAIRGLI